ncbi:MAG: hypothetical protein AB7T18_17760 [Alphaproteobacteria bacterium]
MPYRAQFTEALTLLARAIAKVTADGYEPPVLVGGAAVEFFTSGDIASGDFDLVTPHQNHLEEALLQFGFVRTWEAGELIGGVVHRELGFGVQIVSGHLMDGRAERWRVMVIEVEPGAPISLIPVEDLIAGRMAQAFAERPIRKDMLDQAVKLYTLAESVDEIYLDKRICEETVGDASLTHLKQYVP